MSIFILSAFQQKPTSSRIGRIAFEPDLEDEAGVFCWLWTKTGEIKSVANKIIMVRFLGKFGF
jgi:hypothetical protein